VNFAFGAGPFVVGLVGAVVRGVEPFFAAAGFSCAAADPVPPLGFTVVPYFFVGFAGAVLAVLLDFSAAGFSAVADFTAVPLDFASSKRRSCSVIPLAAQILSSVQAAPQESSSLPLHSSTDIGAPHAGHGPVKAPPGCPRHPGPLINSPALIGAPLSLGSCCVR
jgi:hypothetical protein